MIGRVLWWVLLRTHGAGLNVTDEMLDGLAEAIREQSAAMGLEVPG